MADRQDKEGLYWGGLYANLGLEANTAIGKSDKLLVSLAFDYTLQERKFKTIFFETLDSNMMHLLGLSLGLVFKM